MVLEVKIKNLSDNFATFSFKVSRCMADFNGYKNWDFLPLLGYASKNGLSAEKPSKELWLAKNEDSGWMKMPAYGKVLHIYNESESSPFYEVEIRVRNKTQDISHLFLWKDKPQTFHVYLYYFPESAKPPRLILKTADEFLEETIQYIRSEMKDFPLKKNPKLIPFSTDFSCKDEDDPEWIKKNLLLLKEIGLNCFFDTENSLLLSQLVKDMGFLYVDHWGLSSWPLTYDGFERKRKEYAITALRSLDTYYRRINRDNVKVLHGDDEISSGSFEDFILLDSQVQPLVVSYFRKMNVLVSDIGVKSYEDVRLIPEGAKPPYKDFLKKENPALFYWLNKARMEYMTDLIAETGKITQRYYSDAFIISPNWPAAGVLGGGYDNHGWDFWLAYRKKGLNGIYGEPTPWYNFYLQGIFSWYADMMRSHVKNGPMGAYITTARGSYPCFLNHFQVYELAARGMEHFHWYSYGGMWGNENYANEIVRDLLREFAIVHREFAEAEDYLYGSKPEKAEVAILWTPAQEMWDPSLHQELIALYLILLHSNYNVDIISSYDVDDGILKNYRVLYMPFSYVERKTFNMIKAWVEKGGKLVVDGGLLKDEYDRGIEILEGYRVSLKKTSDIGSLAHLLRHNLIDEATDDSSIRFPVISQKAELRIPSDARVLLRYKDGSPAAFEVTAKKGRIMVTGFLLGVAYQRDEEEKDRPDWARLNVGHNFSSVLRDFATKFVNESGIKRVCGIEKDMVVARKRIKGSKQIIAVFDYHFGKSQEELVYPEWEHIGETVVKIDVGKARSVRSVRGNVIKREGSDIWVKFRGMDFILIDR
ncbi:MAG: hypothetical protein NC913_09310 [Candidatus Omnitrophica bacterium]|nr:hypothetical protein [Candidatus Omnitrophota bacterium]